MRHNRPENMFLQGTVRATPVPLNLSHSTFFNNFFFTLVKYLFIPERKTARKSLRHVVCEWNLWAEE